MALLKKLVPKKKLYAVECALAKGKLETSNRFTIKVLAYNRRMARQKVQTEYKIKVKRSWVSKKKR